MTLKLEDGNFCNSPKNLNITGIVRGVGNRIEIGDVEVDSQLSLVIFGNNNNIKIGNVIGLKKSHIRLGVRESTLANNCNIQIGNNFSSESDFRILMYNHSSNLTIGDDCMISNTVTIRLGERPHLIFDKETGEYLDLEGNVNIGNKVWVGEGCYITKKVSISDGSIVGANSVVTRKFDKNNVVIAGNPAKVVKESVKWERNKSKLLNYPKDSKYKISYDKYEEKHKYEEK